MPTIRRPSLIDLCYLTAVVAVAAFWLVYATERHLYTEWGTVIKNSQKPPLLDGRVLTFDHFLSPALKRHGDGRYLVLVTSDQCKYSHDEQNAWQELLATLRVRGNDSVVIVSTSGDSIPTLLRRVLNRSGIPNQTLHVTNRAGFAEQTGLAWTPHTMVLDSNMRVRLTSERVTPVVAEQIRQWSLDPSQTERR